MQKAIVRVALYVAVFASALGSLAAHGVNRPLFHSSSSGSGSGSGSSSGSGSGSSSGGVTPIPPPDAGAYWIDLDPQHGVTQTSGSVSAWTDQGPAGANMAASGTNEPTYTTSCINGLPCVVSNGTSSWMTTSSTPNPSSSQETAYFVGTVTSGTAVFEQSATIGSNNAINLQNASTTAIQPNMGATSGGVETLSIWTNTRSSHFILTMLYDRTRVVEHGNASAHQIIAGLGRNLQSGAYGANTQTGAFAASGWNLFARSGVVAPAAVHIDRLLVYNTLHSSATRYGVIESLSSEYNLITTTPTRNIVITGDSISSSGAAGGSDTESWADLLVDSGSYPTYTFQNFAFTGRTLQDMAAHVSDEMVAAYRPGVPNYAIIWGGTNDIAQSTTVTGSTLYGYDTTIVSALTTAGFTHIDLVGTLPRCGSFSNGQTQSGFETVRQALRTLQIAGAGSSYTFTDISNDPTIGQAGQCTNGTYYNTDDVHPLIGTKETIEVPTYFEPLLNGWNNVSGGPVNDNGVAWGAAAAIAVVLERRRRKRAA